jgi:geranylgeranyl pyrophosphate synthase
MVILQRVGRDVLNDDDVAEVQDIMRTTGALAEMESVIDRLVAEAVHALDALPFSHEVKRELEDLAQYVSARLV